MLSRNVLFPTELIWRGILIKPITRKKFNSLLNLSAYCGKIKLYIGKMLSFEDSFGKGLLICVVSAALPVRLKTAMKF